jgi:hypothetical protein
MNKQDVENHNRKREKDAAKTEQLLRHLDRKHKDLVELISKELHRIKYYRRKDESFRNHVERALHRRIGAAGISICIAKAMKQLEFLK